MFAEVSGRLSGIAGGGWGGVITRSCSEWRLAGWGDLREVGGVAPVGWRFVSHESVPSIVPDPVALSCVRDFSRVSCDGGGVVCRAGWQ